MAIRAVTVTELNRYIKDVLTGDPLLANITVTGEISYWKPSERSGAVFFTIKDENAQLDCVMWENAVQRLTMTYSVGHKVDLHGRVDYWNNRGQLKFNVFFMEPAGEGELNARYEKLKKDLAAEGLFDNDRKMPLAPFPKNVYVVTAKDGSAVEDIKKTIIERNDYVDITVYPVKVQGKGAAEEIAHAIDHINKMKKADVMIVGRGGGSPEERWAFNEEIVVRSIAASKIPVVTGIGHEDNEHLADLTADFYAKTPTAAAMAAVPDTFEIREDMAYTLEEIEKDFSRYINNIDERVENMHPMRLKNRLRAKAEYSGQLLYREFDLIDQAMQNFINDKERLVESADPYHHERVISGRIELNEGRCDRIIDASRSTIHDIMNRLDADIKLFKTQLDSLDPKKVMKRGYGFVTGRDGRMIRSVEDIKIDDDLRITMRDGTIDSKVISADQRSE